MWVHPARFDLPKCYTPSVCHIKREDLRKGKRAFSGYRGVIVVAGKLQQCDELGWRCKGRSWEGHSRLEPSNRRYVAVVHPIMCLGKGGDLGICLSRQKMGLGKGREEEGGRKGPD